MSSEKPNTTNQTPPPDWKAEFDKHWHKVSQRSADFYNDHKQLFKLSNIGAALGGAVALTWLASGVYIVDEGNRGVVTRFGAYTETTQPGPHWHMPLPIEKSKSLMLNNNALSKWATATLAALPKQQRFHKNL
jgi:membrane protease subunit HflK